MSRGVTVIRKDGVVPFGIKSVKFVYLFALARLYSIGSGRTCPLCDFSGWRFRTAGDPPRREAACPKCGARERRRLLWLYIERETEIERNEGRILYFAPRENIAGKLRKDSIVVTTDLLMEHVDVHSDITRLPFSESAFDAIICSHVLEHVPEDGAAIAELHRVLAPGGRR